MKQLKKEALESVKTHLDKQILELNYQLRIGKRNINELAKKQSLLKKQIHEFNKLKHILFYSNDK